MVNETGRWYTWLGSCQSGWSQGSRTGYDGTTACSSNLSLERMLPPRYRVTKVPKFLQVLCWAKCTGTTWLDVNCLSQCLRKSPINTTNPTHRSEVLRPAFKLIRCFLTQELPANSTSLSALGTPTPFTHKHLRDKKKPTATSILKVRKALSCLNPN